MVFKKLTGSTPATVAKSAEVTAVVGSPQQQAIWDEIVHGTSHLIIEARAGTGKTFTIINALHRLPKGTKAAFCAFNKAIAVYLQTSVPSGIPASTMHSMGYRLLRENGLSVTVDNYKTSLILEELLGERPNYNTSIAVDKLVSFCKSNMIDPNEDRVRFAELLDDIIFQHDLKIHNRDEVIRLVPQVLVLGMNEFAEVIDYDDMIWLPLMLPKFKFETYDLLMVDEAQDLNRAQQQFALRSGKRLCLVGDPFQSIYGFRGADVESIPRMIRTLSDTPLKAKCLPLTVTRRCPKSHVRLAQKLVPDIEHMDEIGEGTISKMLRVDSFQKIKYGDMVICRTNAPLLSYAYNLIQRDVKVLIQGRDIGKGLVSLIKRLTYYKAGDGPSVDELIGKLDDYAHNEEMRMLKSFRNSEAKLQAFRDKVECLKYVTEGLKTTKEVIARIDYLFGDVDQTTDRSKIVTLSSIHRAKGLEAETVWILEPHLLPGPWAKHDWDKQQERNIAYVAVTRSKRDLIFVGTDSQFFPNIQLQGTTEEVPIQESETSDEPRQEPEPQERSEPEGKSDPASGRTTQSTKSMATKETSRRAVRALRKKATSKVEVILPKTPKGKQSKSQRSKTTRQRKR